MEIKVQLKFNYTTKNIIYIFEGKDVSISNWREFEFSNSPIQIDELKNLKDAELEVEEITKNGVRKLKLLSILYKNKKYTRKLIEKNALNKVNFLNIFNDISATAPYNFIPLNSQIIYPDNQDVFFDRYNVESRNSGYIELKIVNHTHLFIRGNGTEFLKINNGCIIPGSSLRGLLRSLVEIVSYSKMEFINNSRYYYRSFADKAIRLRDEYAKEMKRQASVGILYRDQKTKNYYLIPTSLMDKVADTSIISDAIYSSSDDTWMLYSGKMKNKNYNYKIMGKSINDPGRLTINWNDELIIEYKEDKNRSGLDIIKEIEKTKYKANGIPIFYQTNEAGNISSIGNTMNYRLPYEFKVLEHFYENHLKIETYMKSIDGKEREFEKLDFANLIFGKVTEKSIMRSEDSLNTIVASRVYVEDSICSSPLTDEKSTLKTLGGPKPTSFQLYLKQPNGKNTIPEKLVHWNDNKAVIRGYKQYWHRYTSKDYENHYSWREKNLIEDNVHSKPIIPL
ncbi:MAG: RAMP superfamily CRISPR-associated protein, partial [Saprospiraceae bacterium]